MTDITLQKWGKNREKSVLESELEEQATEKNKNTKNTLTYEIIRSNANLIKMKNIKSSLEHH